MNPEFQEAVRRANLAVEESSKAINDSYLCLRRAHEAIIACQYRLLAARDLCDDVGKGKSI